MHDEVAASVVVVTHNSARHIRDCLKSLSDQDFPEPWEIIVVDSGSSDDTVSIVGKEFPNVSVYPTPNRGFGAGNNHGAARAQGKYLAFVNPDTVADRAWLRELVAPLQVDSVVTTSKILLLGSPGRINTCGNDLHFTGYSFVRDYKAPEESVDTDIQVDGISGAAFALRREDYLNIGGFDEDFFLYHEDTDLSWSLRRAGFRILLASRSRVWHDYRLSVTAPKMVHLETSRLLLLRKHYTARHWVLLLPSLLLAEGMAWAWAARLGWSGLAAKGKAWRAGLGRISRRRLPRLRLRDVTRRKIPAPLLARGPLARFGIGLANVLFALNAPLWRSSRRAPGCERRIALVEKYEPTGRHGRAVRLAGLQDALVKRGDCCIVFALSGADGVRAAPSGPVVQVASSSRPVVQATVGAVRLYRRLRRFEANQGRFDSIQVENPQLLIFCLLLRMAGIPFDFEAHVVEKDYWRSSPERGLRTQAATVAMVATEHFVFRLANRVMALSEADAQRIVLMEPRLQGRVHILPHCVSTEFLQRPVGNATAKSCLFLGAYTHPANREAVTFIVDHVAPEMLRRDPNVRFVMAGSGMPANLPGANVVVRADVADVIALIDEAAVCIAPVFQGSGVRTKLLEYFARGKPVVATQTAMYGIHAIEGHHYIPATTPGEFCSGILGLLGDARQAEMFGQAGQELIRQEHTWAGAAPRLEARFGYWLP